MKKRLLSAALALAMVLTLLPMTVFATVTLGDGVSVSYKAAGTVIVNAGGGTNPAAGYFYDTGDKTTEGNKAVYAEATGGVVAGGKYYSTGDAALAAKATSITVISGTPSFDLTKATGTTLTIDINGCNVSFSGTLSNHTSAGDGKTTLTSLTVKNSGATAATVGGSIKAVKQGFSFTGENFSSGSLTLEVDNTGTTTAQTLSVKLTGAEVGDITAKNAKVSVNASANTSGRKSVITSITTNDGATAPKSNARTGTGTGTSGIVLSGRSEVSGKVTIYGAGSVSLSGMSKITGGIDLYGGTKADNDNKSTPNWKTTVTVDGTSTVGPITQQEGDENGHKIDVKGGSVVGKIDMSKGGSSDIDFNSAAASAATAPDIEIARGTVDIKNSAVGNITAGHKDESGAVTITVGTKGAADTSKVGDVKKATDAKSTPALIVYGGTVGKIGEEGTPITHEVWGGTVGSKVDKANLKGGLEKGYQIKLTESTEGGGSSETYTYTTNFQDLIDKYAASGFEATRVNDAEPASGNTSTVSFKWDTADGSETLAELKITKGTMLHLPNKVNGTTVNYWYDAKKAGLSPVDNPFLVSDDTVTLAAQISAKTDKVVTGVKAEDLFSKPDGDTPIGAALNGTTINLSGAVELTATTASIKVYFEVDGKYAGEAAATPDTTAEDEGGDTSAPAASSEQSVTVGWDSETGKIVLSNPQGDGVTLPSTQSNQVKVYDTTYTVTGTGLKPIVSKVKIGNLTGTDRSIVVPNASAGMTGAYVELGKDVKKSFEDTTKSTANFSAAYDVQTALNAVIAGLSESSVSGYVNQARSAMASYHNKKLVDNRKDWKAADFNEYDTLVLTPYLEISSSNPTTPGDGGNSILTLTITLKARYTVQQSGDASKTAYKDKAADNTETPWESAVNLSVKDNCGQVDIELTMPDSTGLVTKDGDAYVHHDGQVYKVNWSSKKAKIENKNGFANKTFVINNTAGAFEVYANKEATTAEATYDTLQDAVNAVKNGEVIVAGASFNGAITVSGVARKFTIKADEDKAKVTVTITEVRGASTTYSFDKSSNTYEIQLIADTAEPGKNIVVATVTGGVAAVSANPAKAGQTVTVTLTPVAGYVSKGVTVKTNTGATVTVSGSGNTYTFTMPANATTVTVTPAFVLSTTATDTRATVSVNNTSGGSAYTSAIVTENKAEQGSTLVVTAVPNNGYRSMDVTARTNTGATVATTRTGTNTWNVVVPAGATVVTVTPSFDINNGTPFTDVKNSDWHSKYVSWVYQNKYFEGKGTYTFAPADYITRGEVVATLWKAEGSPIVSYVNPFKDVPTNYWAYNAVMWAASKGYIDTSTGYFNGTGYANRAEVVSILYKRAGSPTVYGTSGFADVASSASYSKAVTWARQKGLTNGYGGSTYFRPGYAISRAEVAAFIARAFGNMT